MIRKYITTKMRMNGSMLMNISGAPPAACAYAGVTNMNYSWNVRKAAIRPENPPEYSRSSGHCNRAWQAIPRFSHQSAHATACAVPQLADMKHISHDRQQR
jgi:hypothetical protein